MDGKGWVGGSIWHPHAAVNVASTRQRPPDTRGGHTRITRPRRFSLSRRWGPVTGRWCPSPHRHPALKLVSGIPSTNPVWCPQKSCGGMPHMIPEAVRALVLPASIAQFCKQPKTTELRIWDVSPRSLPFLPHPRCRSSPGSLLLRTAPPCLYSLHPPGNRTASFRL